MTSKIDKAIALAATAHKDQTRKASDLPYIAHPFSVGMLLSQSACEEDVIIAGILHDTVEDTWVTLTDVKAEFGDTVAKLVEGASEPDKGMSWEDRKEHTINSLKTADVSVCLIVCADKCHNIQSLVSDYDRLGDEMWTYFHRGRDKQAWYYQNILSVMKKRLNNHPLVRQLEASVRQLFS